MDFATESQLHLSVSIVLHNSCLALLQRALHSLQDSAREAENAGCLHQLSVTLVDNASEEHYRVQLAQVVADWPESKTFHLQCSQQSCNRGFGHGHNTVIEPLASDYHLVLNPDVELQKDSLRLGLSFLQANDDVVLLSPKVYGTGGEQEFLCKRYPSVLVLLLRGFAPGFVNRLFHERLAAYEMRDLCSTEQRVDVAIASGCFMLARTPVLQAVGGFNENFFLYFEDFDLSLRLEHRGRLVFDPSMRIVHHGGYAASKGWHHLRYFMTSGVMFFNRHGWRWI
jgi:GT2 family glycosyltransferase